MTAGAPAGNQTMCGRFTLTFNSETLQLSFGLAVVPDPPVEPRYNISPSQDVPVILMLGGERIVRKMRWGLIPRWAKDESVGNRLINARAETIDEKNSFKNSFKHRRCLVPADGFYEWRREKGRTTKQPIRFVMKSGAPFALAGLWDVWRRPVTGAEVQSFTIVTTTANELLATIHDRMPVILNKENEDEWLDPENSDTGRLKALLKPYPATLMTFHEVSTAVNSPTHDSPELILPLKPSGP